MRSLKIAAVAAAVVGAAYYARIGCGAPTLESVAEAVRKLNEGLPAMADAGTRLDKVTLGEKEIVYEYALIDFSTYDVSGDQLAHSLRPRLREAACSASMMKPLWRNGYSARYRFYGKRKRLITEVVLYPHDCGLASIPKEQ